MTTLDEIENETKADRRAFKDALNAKDVNGEDESDPVATTPKAVVWKASNKRRRHLTRPDAEARTVGTPGYVKIPKPQLPMPDWKFVKQTQDYMNQQANLGYGGPPPKAPPPIFVRPVPEPKGDSSVNP